MRPNRTGMARSAGTCDIVSWLGPDFEQRDTASLFFVSSTSADFSAFSIAAISGVLCRRFISFGFLFVQSLPERQGS